MTDGTLLLVDMSYQVYRAAAAHPRLTSGRVFTGGLYGFFVTVAKMIRETRATQIAFCQDVKPYKRSEVYPEYKQIRKKSADEELIKAFKQSMSLVLDTLHAAQLPVWGIKGFEFDDLAGHAVEKYRHRYKMIYAGTNDSDLFQLLTTPRFAVYRQSITDVMDMKAFQNRYKMTADQYVLWLALQGTHNDIAGIDGVGEITATKAINDPAALRKWRDSHGAIIDRNIKLIRLPHPEFPHDAEIPRGGPYDHRALIRALSKYDIDFTASIDKSLWQVAPTV
jgi:5'-3' exonuclease